MIHYSYNSSGTKVIEIESVSDFIQKIKELKDNCDDISKELYFRGQETDYWDIMPSIFRDDMLSIEHKLMQAPLQKNPTEFKEFDSKFDIMAKYQHYGMCTRLLDLTTNPLVALYFACQLHGAEAYYTQDENQEILYDENGQPITEEKEPNGLVFFSNKYYPSSPETQEVKVISALAGYDLSKENTVAYVLDKLLEDEIISQKLYKKWSTDGNGEFIEAIQNNYMVMPTYSNERLKKQSGVFLLTGMFTVNEDKITGQRLLTKTKGSLKNVFCEETFLIKGEIKEEIIKELDLYNINEATLFPELEHQLGYIRWTNSYMTKPVSTFSYFESVARVSEEVKIDYVQNSKKMNSYLETQLPELIRNRLEDAYLQDIGKIITDNFIIDWYKKESTYSKIKMQIITYLTSRDVPYDKYEAKKTAELIIEDIKESVRLYTQKGNEV